MFYGISFRLISLGSFYQMNIYLAITALLYEQRNTYLSGLWRIIYPRNRPIEIMAPGKLFDQGRVELFDVPDRLIVPAGEEIILEK